MENLGSVENIDSVIRFWFGDSKLVSEISAEKSALWWSKNPEIDDEITQRFETLTQQVANNELGQWNETPKGMLAMILCTDQFPRNMYRDTPAAFSYDSKALSYANALLEKGWEKELSLIERVFAYLPFEHSEVLEDQLRSVALFEELAAQAEDDEEIKATKGFLDFAIKHHEFIKRFGRFPHRNRILGRESTAEEVLFLQEPGSSF